MLDLADAVLLGILSTPSPIQAIFFNGQSVLGLYPSVMVPAFAVPSSILLHALSLRQLRRLAASKNERRPAVTSAATPVPA